MAEKLLHGTLFVKIYEAKNLIDMDNGGVIGGLLHVLGAKADRNKSDPYATVLLPPEAIVARTRVLKDTSNPVWNESFWIKVAHKTKEVVIEVRDADRVGAFYLGTMRIPVDDLLEGKQLQGWYALFFGNSPARASIRLKLQFHSVDALKAQFGRVGEKDKELGVPNTFFPVRTGNRVTLYQDAHVSNRFNPYIELANYTTYRQHRLWEDVYQTIVDARHFIYVCGWSLYYDIRLVRDEERMIPGAEGLTLGNLLKKKADSGVKVLLLVWNDRTSGCVDGFSLMDTKDNKTAEFFEGSKVKCVLAGRRPDKDLTCKESAEAFLLFSHHQKLVVADAPRQQGGSDEQRRVVAYVGGIDLCDGRFDDQDHSLFRTLDTWHKDDFHQISFSPAASHETGGPRQPWHDIHAKVEGPSAWDVLYNFEQRWRSYRTKDIDDLYHVVENQGLFQAPYAPFLPEDDPEVWNVQFFRSIDSGSVHGFPDDPEIAANRGLVSGKDVTVERSIQDAYVHAIRRAEEFIYIENQYFLGSCFAWHEQRTVTAIHTVPVELALKVVRKIDAGERFAVYVVLPMWPEGVPSSGSMQEMLKWQNHTMRMMYRMVAEAITRNGLAGAKPTDYLNFYCLGKREAPSDDEYRPTQQIAQEGHYKKSQKYRRHMIYVHSKLMITDDEFVVVGSANINQRSMDGSRDTESAIGAYQPFHTHVHNDAELPRGQVHGFRMSLWAEHTGRVEEVFLQPSLVQCVRRVNEIAKANWQKYVAEKTEDMTSHILPFPVYVGDDGIVGPLPGFANFPDTEAYVLGQAKLLPDILTT